MNSSSTKLSRPASKPLIIERKNSGIEVVYRAAVWTLSRTSNQNTCLAWWSVIERRSRLWHNMILSLKSYIILSRKRCQKWLIVWFHRPTTDKLSWQTTLSRFMWRRPSLINGFVTCSSSLKRIQISKISLHRSITGWIIWISTIRSLIQK